MALSSLAALSGQERQQLIAEVQLRVDRLKKEQKKRDALEAKINVGDHMYMRIGKGSLGYLRLRQRYLAWKVRQALAIALLPVPNPEISAAI